MSDDERPWPDYPILSWFWLALTKYRSKLIGGEDSEYPLEFLKAVEEHIDANKKSILRDELWTALQKWKKYIKAHPKFLPASQPVTEFLRLWPPSDERKEAEDFQNLVLNAVFGGDRELLQLLFEIAPLRDAPQRNMNGIRAVIAAFCECFPCGLCEGLYDLSTKKELRAATNEILQKASLPPLSDRQFTRILNDDLGLGRALQPAKKPSKRAHRRRIG
jgi:hypothetical protein